MVSENTPKSEIGKISVQNWKSDPMNSPKAFGELIIHLNFKLGSFVDPTIG